jgi:type I restriction enzyme S subunit
VTTITGPDLARLEIALPPLPEQRAIAEVLGALDDKIESNRNQILSSDHLYLSICEEALSHRSTCQPTRLGDVAEVSLGGTPSRKNPDFWMEGTIPWVNSGCLHERPLITPADWITDEGLARSSTKLIEPGAVLVAITGATLGVVSRLGIRAAINQSVVAISCPEAPPLEGFLYYWIRSRVERLVSSATGGAQQHINKGNVEDFPVEVPDDDALVRIGAALPLLDRQVALTRQNQILESLRDTLLPELLAGRIRVSEAREHVEDSP